MMILPLVLGSAWARSGRSRSSRNGGHPVLLATSAVRRNAAAGSCPARPFPGYRCSPSASSNRQCAAGPRAARLTAQDRPGCLEIRNSAVAARISLSTLGRDRSRRTGTRIGHRGPWSWPPSRSTRTSSVRLCDMGFLRRATAMSAACTGHALEAQLVACWRPSSSRRSPAAPPDADPVPQERIGNLDGTGRGGETADNFGASPSLLVPVRSAAGRAAWDWARRLSLFGASQRDRAGPTARSAVPYCEGPPASACRCRLSLPAWRKTGGHPKLLVGDTYPAVGRGDLSLVR
jgi:hypothetical protein